MCVFYRAGILAENIKVHDLRSSNAAQSFIGCWPISATVEICAKTLAETNFMHCLPVVRITFQQRTITNTHRVTHKYSRQKF